MRCKTLPTAPAPMRKAPSTARQGGFGLLEAIVALVILGSSGLMLFAWINQSLVDATRLKDAEGRAQLRLEAQGMLSKLNPALEPEGDRKLGDLRIRWRSELVEPMRDEFNYGGNLVPRWQIGLFRVSVDAERSSAGLRVGWVQLVAGWRSKAGFAPPAADGGKS